ncbi:hypothetical protein [Streptomyces sp. NPDC045251]|uniref:hypothetical protein n=1 Tax=unclassified Streptomyces TaxID=2593676 RepID=UPI0033E09249
MNRQKRPQRPKRPAHRPDRLSPLTRSRIGTWTGGGLVSAGVGFQWGLPVALIVAGVLLTAYCLLIADVSPGRTDRRP